MNLSVAIALSTAVTATAPSSPVSSAELDDSPRHASAELLSAHPLRAHGAPGISIEDRAPDAELARRDIAQLARANSTTPITRLKRWKVEELSYLGGYRITSQPCPKGGHVNSSFDYSDGVIAYNPGNHSLFMSGHDKADMLAEIQLPAQLRKTDSVARMNMATRYVQCFSPIWPKFPGGPDEIRGLNLVDGQLLVGVIVYYDANADKQKRFNLGIFRNASQLAKSPVAGWMRIDGSARTAGWKTPVPPPWQDALGGDWLAGFSSGDPIIGRHSVGPSAWSFNMSEVLSGKLWTKVPALPLLNWNLPEVVGGRPGGMSFEKTLTKPRGKAQAWSHVSFAKYAFIIPGTRTYLAIGQSGGHHSGIGYKGPKDPDPRDPNNVFCNYQTSGYCPLDPKDRYTYYWAFDLADMAKVARGELDAWEVAPYAHGPFPSPWPRARPGGGSFDPKSGRLYLSMLNIDRSQGKYARTPTILVYDFSEKQ